MGPRELVRLLRSDLGRLSPPNAANRPAIRRVLKVFSPRFLPVVNLRLAQWAAGTRLTRPFAMLFSIVNLALFGLEVTPRCRIGPGLFLPHTSGTVIGAQQIGDNVTIFQGVTLGAKFADLDFMESQRPTVGNNVVIGAGAKVLGGVRIGEGAVIAANSLVLEDVPAGALMIGVPATARRNN